MKKRNCSLAVTAALIAMCATGTVHGANQNAVNVIQAESYDAMQGIVNAGTGIAEFDGAEGDWIKYTQTNFGTGVSVFKATVAVDPEFANQAIEIRLDSPTGTKVGELIVQSTGDWNTFVEQSVPITTVTGVHDLYLVAAPDTWGVANIDKFQFVAATGSVAREAENYSAMQGVTNSGTGIEEFDGAEGDWIRYSQINFGTGVNKFKAWVAVDAQYAGQIMEIRLDSVTGTKVGELTVQPTGGWSTFAEQSTALSTTITGVHDLYLVGAPDTWGIANIDKFEFVFETGTGPVDPPPGQPPKVPSGPVTLSGAGPHIVENKIISGGPGPCISIDGATTSVLIRNVELTNCESHGIAISNSSNVTIQDSLIHNIIHDSVAKDGINADAVTNLLIQNTTFTDIYTDVADKNPVTRQHQDPAVAVHLFAVVNAEIKNNTFVRVGSGVYAQEFSQAVNVHHNTGNTMKGPYPRGQLVQFASMNSANSKIQCNVVDNGPDDDAEDLINLSNARGTATSPILVRYNKLKRGSSGSGSGIVVGDGGGRYIQVIGNRVVDPMNAGIGVAGGSDIVVSDNKVFAAQQIQYHEGIYVHQGTNITVDHNRLNWNGWDYAFTAGTGVRDYNGTPLSASASGAGSNTSDDPQITSAIFNDNITECN